MGKGVSRRELQFVVATVHEIEVQDEPDLAHDVRQRTLRDLGSTEHNAVTTMIRSGS